MIEWVIGKMPVYLNGFEAKRKKFEKMIGESLKKDYTYI